ncbi:glycerol kinase GlpK [Bdellovibrio sp. HCB337]|uniref:glycerol kinase GlpK n=1 Tax=Bdellovibrio sp. HCB337 TaxID=3394358 RepID=UPI0039A67A94
MSRYIIAIDQGTTSSRTAIVNQAGGLVHQNNEDFRQIFPKPGWVEHDPEDIWKTTVNTLKKAMEQTRLRGDQIAAIGITNQRETVVVWDRKTGKPIYNAIVWQCRRTQDVCEKLKRNNKEKMVTKKTGLVIDPYFSGSKIQWILKNVPGAKEKARKGELAAGTIDSFLLWRLTGGESHKTDVSNASRTMLMNIHTGWWDEDLMKLFEVPASMLPEIAPSSGEFGTTKGLGMLPDGIPIAGIAGDQQAALFGQTCFDMGDVKCTFGTGSFILLNTGPKAVASKARLLTTIAWKLRDEKMVYALEGGAFICGAAVQWLRDGLQFFQHSSEVEQLAASVTSSEGVEFVPALTGLGAPHWNSDARGVICGLTRGSTKAHVARATLEAMALQNVDILTAMQKDLGRKLKSIKVDGGASSNNLLMQLQADYSSTQVVRPQIVESTALGAAYLAGLGVGFWKNTGEIKKIWKVDQEFKVAMNSKDRATRLGRWAAALKRV